MHAFITDTPPQILPKSNLFEIHPETSIGIDEIRQIQHFLSRKSTSGENLIILHEAHSLTIPAQNAFLKTLEEPPANTNIYLITSYPDQLLPTIISRCQILISNISTNQKFDTQSLKSLFEAKTASQKLLWVDNQEFDRASALDFLHTCEQFIHDQVISQKPVSISYDQIVLARKYLKANCSVRLCMDNFALSL